ncbi:MAG: dihydrodipicolinate synthase family protein, partial [Planctomycetaceae bacterium]|nr:dihydrodipicolinate synthase family protein [Planctomycetaceae bacterium]
PELTRKLYDLTTSYQIDAAREVQYDLIRLFDTMIYSAEFPEGFRAAVELRGFRMGQGRQPLSDDQRTDLTVLSRELQCLLSQHGFTDQPVGGCPVGDSNPSSSGEEVGAIVQQVVSELRRRGLM